MTIAKIQNIVNFFIFNQYIYIFFSISNSAFGYLFHKQVKNVIRKKSTPWKFLIFQERELSDFKIKKFLIFLEMDTCTVRPNLEKLKGVHPQENFLYSWKMEISNSNIKKLLTFSQKKLFWYFRKHKPRKNIWYFLKRKPVLYFRKRNFLILQEETCKAGLKIRFHKINEKYNATKQLWIYFSIKGRKQLPTTNRLPAIRSTM